VKLAATGFWFIVVGLAAALTHAAVFGVARAWWWPEVANAAGFAVAFFVSFAGHRRLSFADHRVDVWTSLRRFALTAVLGFAVNEGVFVLLLRGLHWSAWLALVGAMAVAAGQTFVLGRFWAFRR